MANKDKTNLKQGFQDMIDRVPPYDSEPLIQKADHQITVGDDFMDSAIVRLPTIAAINNPSAAFNVDFDQGDRFDVDTTGSASASFTVTLSGLNDNETGILSFTKKANDTVSFSNAVLTPFGNVSYGQEGVTDIAFFVKVIDGSYIVNIGYTYGSPVLSEDSNIQYRIKRILIGAYNMESITGVNSVFIPHGISDWSNIEDVRAKINNDSGTDSRNMESGGVDEDIPPVFTPSFTAVSWDATNIKLSAGEGGYYDRSDYSSQGVNRGVLTIKYIL